MTTSDRVLGVLGLFTLEHSEWTVEAAAAHLELAVSTAYRYFRSLSRCGLIVAIDTGRYVLGPAIIQFDRQIRLQDPLIAAARPVMTRLTADLPPHTLVLLCRLFRNQVMCIQQEAVDPPDYAVSYERGRPMPLFRGAASKIILANLPLRTVRTLFVEHRAQFSQAGLGRDWDEVKGHLRMMRAAGESTTRGEIDPGMCGVAVPLFDASGAVIGSLSIVMPARRLKNDMVSPITAHLRKGATEIRRTLSLGTRRPRAKTPARRTASRSQGERGAHQARKSVPPG
jgi:DNA-binding IclR family transcriptional regulator